MLNKYKYIIIAISVAVAIGLFLIVQKMDYEDDLIEQRIYCERVNGGFWGDYNGIYEEECNE